MSEANFYLAISQGCVTMAQSDLKGYAVTITLGSVKITLPERVDSPYEALEYAEKYLHNLLTSS